jgi:hypothetical protein
VNIRDGGKTVHVVFKYLKGGGGGVPPVTTTHFLGCSVDISFKDDITVILLLNVSFMLSCLFGCHSATGLFFYFNNVTRCSRQGEIGSGQIFKDDVNGFPSTSDIFVSK